MPDSTIETLDIQVKSSTARAVTALDNLANKLYDVSKAFKSVDTGSIRNYSREIGRVSSSLKSMSGIKINVPKLSGLSKQLQSLTNVNFTALNASSKPLKELASGLNALKGVSGVTIPKLDYKNINSVSKAIEKIGKLDTGNIQNSVNGISKVSHAMSVLNNVDFSDSKISSVINSIRKLMAVDTKGFDTQIFDSIYKSVSKLGNLPDVSSSINRLVASLARLISSGNNTGVVASKLPAVGNAIKQTANKLASVKGVEESINQFISALASLSSAGKKVELSANGLQIMAKELLSFFNTMSKAPAVSKNTVEMTKALAQLAASGGRVSSAVNTMNTSFGKLRNGFSELASLASRAGSTVSSGIGKMVNAIRNIGSASGSISTVNFSLKNLIQTAIGFKAVQAFGQFTKDAITLGSDITEAENVIDVSFGKLKYKAYDFASTASKQFGVSELAAKRYTGTIMAMLKSSGVAQNAASDMSVALAGLAGDIASFYNIDTDTAFYKIRAGISGEIEPLKQLGINMSVANMSAYALANGITKSWTSMTQAEQATLRYNYLMSVTKDAQGDFARTAGTWANQVRLLKLNIQSLSAVMGQGIIAAVLPAIKALNALMSRLMQAANMFRNFMYVLMGKKIKGATKGVVNDLGGVGDSATDLSGLGSAGNDASKG
jgi:methyl-accepting chemotaxis protein